MKRLTSTVPGRLTRPGRSAEVHEHDVLRPLLGVGPQLLLEGQVLLLVPPARPRAGDSAVLILSPSTLTSISGEAPARATSPKST